MELHIFYFGMFMMNPFDFYQGLLTPWPRETYPGGRARRLVCSNLGNRSPKVYEVENKELVLLEKCQNVKSTLPYMHL